MPVQWRRRVEEFVTIIRASARYLTIGLGNIDPASATLRPLYRSLDAIRNENYEAQILVTTPIFRLFSTEARVGIIAHEFVHAVRASRLGCGWHEKMQANYTNEEKRADLIAVGWGFGKQIRAMRAERLGTVNPYLHEHEAQIWARWQHKIRAKSAEFEKLIKE